MKMLSRSFTVATPVLIASLCMLSACGKKGGAVGVGGPQASAPLHSSGFAVPFSICAATDARETADLSVARDFNLFLFGDLKQPSADTEGRVAVGGNAELGHYSIGDKLSADAGRADMIVAGDLNWVGGAVTNGAAVVGGKAATTQVSFAGGIHRIPSPIDFGRAYESLSTESVRLAGLKANGKSELKTWGNPRGELTLVGENRVLNVFVVEAETLSRAHTIIIQAPQESRVIINVTGSAVRLVSFGMTLGGISRNAVLFNLPDARTLELGQVSFEGSILAVNADVLFSAGVMWGQLIAHSMSGRGQMNHAPHRSCESTPVPPSPIPQPPPEVPYE